jgi:hypothetical protein
MVIRRGLRRRFILLGALYAPDFSLTKRVVMALSRASRSARSLPAARPATGYVTFAAGLLFRRGRRVAARPRARPGCARARRSARWSSPRDRASTEGQVRLRVDSALAAAHLAWRGRSRDEPARRRRLPQLLCSVLGGGRAARRRPSRAGGSAGGRARLGSLGLVLGQAALLAFAPGRQWQGATRCGQSDCRPRPTLTAPTGGAAQASAAASQS